MLWHKKEDGNITDDDHPGWVTKRGYRVAHAPSKEGAEFDPKKAREALGRIRSYDFHGEYPGWIYSELVDCLFCDDKRIRYEASGTLKTLLGNARRKIEECWDPGAQMNAKYVTSIIARELADDVEYVLNDHSRTERKDGYPLRTGFRFLEDTVTKVLDVETCVECMKTLGVIGSKTSVRTIVSFAGADDARVRNAVAKALKNFRGKEAVETLCCMMLLDDEAVRRSAMISLAAVGEPSSMGAIASAMREGRVRLESGNTTLKIINEMGVPKRGMDTYQLIFLNAFASGVDDNLTLTDEKDLRTVCGELVRKITSDIDARNASRNPFKKALINARVASNGFALRKLTS